MNIYEQRDWKKIAIIPLALIIVVALLLVLGKREVTVEVSASDIPRGEDFYIFVHVANFGQKNEKNVSVSVSPITPFLRVEKNEIVIPVLPKGSEQIPKFKIHVDENAVPGDHVLTVKVIMGEREYKEDVYIRVV